MNQKYQNGNAKMNYEEKLLLMAKDSLCLRDQEISDYLNNRLNWLELLRVKLHLRQCVECQAKLEVIEPKIDITDYEYRPDLGEKVQATENGFEVPFTHLPDTSSAVVLHLDTLSNLEINQALSSIKANWHPKHPDLQNIPIVDVESFAKLSLEEKALCLVLFAPL